MNERWVNRFISLFIFLIVPVTSCSPQSDKTPAMQNNNLINRKPVVAGQFYPGTPEELISLLAKLFSEAEPRKSEGNVLAIISPHAGYVFSGKVAASSFNQIDPEKKYKSIFLIGSSHRVMFDGASIYNKGNFETPLGVVKVDLETANLLIDKYKVFNNRSDAHDQEHSLEVQLPFLQQVMKSDYSIVPVVIATQNPETCTEIAKALKPYFNEDNLFIISTDFSHYPSYSDAVTIDNNTAKAIISNKPEQFISTINLNSKKNIQGLATSICGWTSVLTLMKITEGNNAVTYIPVEYKNSGDAKLYGDKSRVVGYYSIEVIENEEKNSKIEKESKGNEFTLSDKEKEKLLRISRTTLEQFVRKNEIVQVDKSELTENLFTKCGVFVSLHENGQLRGCIGNFETSTSLYQLVQEMTISSASRDYRFSPVDISELDKIEIEISVLTPLRRINSTDEIILGKHGIYIKKDNRSGTFLPQVATSTGWNMDEFLGHCARDKAGIGWEGWKNAELYTYEAIVFKEH